MIQGKKTQDITINGPGGFSIIRRSGISELANLKKVIKRLVELGKLMGNLII